VHRAGAGELYGKVTSLRTPAVPGEKSADCALADPGPRCLEVTRVYYLDSAFKRGFTGMRAGLTENLDDRRLLHVAMRGHRSPRRGMRAMFRNLLGANGPLLCGNRSERWIARSDSC